MCAGLALEPCQYLKAKNIFPRPALSSVEPLACVANLSGDGLVLKDLVCKIETGEDGGDIADTQEEHV